MRSRAAHIVLLLTALALLAGCGHRGRVIPEKKLIRLYTDMFLADQWLRDHADARSALDTTLFFDPIFRRHGYTFEDYDRSVHFYLDRPEKYSKLLNRAADRIRKEGSKVEAEANRLREHDMEIRHLRSLYHRQDLTTDSLRWSGRQTLWPEFVEVPDTTAVADSAAVEGSVLAADSTLPKPHLDRDDFKPLIRERIKPQQ